LSTTNATIKVIEVLRIALVTTASIAVAITRSAAAQIDSESGTGEVGAKTLAGSNATSLHDLLVALVG
jgi:hypothetical protein